MPKPTAQSHSSLSLQRQRRRRSETGIEKPTFLEQIRQSTNHSIDCLNTGASTAARRIATRSQRKKATAACSLPVRESSPPGKQCSRGSRIRRHKISTDRSIKIFANHFIVLPNNNVRVFLVSPPLLFCLAGVYDYLRLLLSSFFLKKKKTDGNRPIKTSRSSYGRKRANYNNKPS